MDLLHEFRNEFIIRVVPCADLGITQKREATQLISDAVMNE